MIGDLHKKICPVNIQRRGRECNGRSKPLIPVDKRFNKKEKESTFLFLTSNLGQVFVRCINFYEKIGTKKMHTARN
jgi:hypothetical protein